MGPGGGGVDCLGLTFNQRRLLKVDRSGSILQWRQSRGTGGNPPPFFYTKKGANRGGQILNIVIMVRVEMKNLEESIFLSIKIVNFSDLLPVRNIKSLTF